MCILRYTKFTAMFHLKNNDSFQMTYSIIIPTYNSAHVIKRCLDSIVSQSYTDYEVLVMDGDSRDDTVKIAKSFGDNRIKVYSEPDKGVYDAMNKGIDISLGNWVLFMGSDDYLIDKDVLEKVSKYLEDEYHVVYGDCKSDRLNPENSGEWMLKNLSYNRCHQGIFYNKSFWETGVRYNISYKLLADYEVNLRWFLDIKHYRSKYMPVQVSFFSSGGISDLFQDTVFHDDYGVLLWHYGRKSLPPKYKKRVLRLIVANSHCCCLAKAYYQVLIAYYFVVQKTQEKHGVCQENLLIKS